MFFRILILVLVCCSCGKKKYSPLEYVQSIVICDSLNNDSVYLSNAVFSIDSLNPIPNSIIESLEIIDLASNDYSRHMFSICGPNQFHFGLGMYIRNNWGLWSGGELRTEIETTFGASHADDMSSIILSLNYLIRQNDKQLIEDYLVQQQTWYGEKVNDAKIEALKTNLFEIMDKMNS